MSIWNNAGQQAAAEDSVRRMAQTPISLALAWLLYRIGWPLLLRWLPSGLVGRTYFAGSHLLELDGFSIFALRASLLVVLALALADIILSQRRWLGILGALLPFLVTMAIYAAASQVRLPQLMFQGVALLLAAVGVAWAFGRFRKANVSQPMGIFACLFKLPGYLSRGALPTWDRLLAVFVMGLSSVAFLVDLAALARLIWQNKELFL